MLAIILDIAEGFKGIISSDFPNMAKIVLDSVARKW
jgi:hypothetical protein